MTTKARPLLAGKIVKNGSFLRFWRDLTSLVFCVVGEVWCSLAHGQ